MTNLSYPTDRRSKAYLGWQVMQDTFIGGCPKYQTIDLIFVATKEY
jgi:hypothetical protein